MLRMFAWLVSNVGSMCRTIFHRNTRDWHTDDAYGDQLPTPGDLTQEPFNAGDTGASKALMASSTQSVRPSNHEGELTAASTPVSAMAFRWGADLSTRTVRTRRNTAPHLTCTRSAHLACSSSPVRGRTSLAHA